MTIKATTQSQLQQTGLRGRESSGESTEHPAENPGQRERVKVLQQDVEAISHSSDKAMEDNEELIRLMEKRRSDVKQLLKLFSSLVVGKCLRFCARWCSIPCILNCSELHCWFTSCCPVVWHTRHQQS